MPLQCECESRYNHFCLYACLLSVRLSVLVRASVRPRAAGGHQGGLAAQLQFPEQL